MKDFSERLRAAIEKPFFLWGHDATVKITEIVDRYPFPADEAEARACKGAHEVFNERYKGKTFYAVEIMYSAKYMKKYDTKEIATHPVPRVCNIIWRTLGLGSIALGSSEWEIDRICFPIPKTKEVYAHLPPAEEAKE